MPQGRYGGERCHLVAALTKHGGRIPGAQYEARSRRRRTDKRRATSNRGRRLRRASCRWDCAPHTARGALAVWRREDITVFQLGEKSARFSRQAPTVAGGERLITSHLWQTSRIAGTCAGGDGTRAAAEDDVEDEEVRRTQRTGPLRRLSVTAEGSSACEVSLRGRIPALARRALAGFHCECG